MLDPRLTAALREAAGSGFYGGWRRDPKYSNSLITVWRHRAGQLVVVMEPALNDYPWTIVRLSQTTADQRYTCLVDAKVDTWFSALRVLAAYGIVPPRHCHYGTHPEVLRG